MTVTCQKCGRLHEDAVNCHEEAPWLPSEDGADDDTPPDQGIEDLDAGAAVEWVRSQEMRSNQQRMADGDLPGDL